MNGAWKRLAACIAIPLLVGGLASFLTRSGMDTFQNIQKPPLSPPGWVFPIVWTILFILMGTASFLVLESGKKTSAVRTALTLYGVQLGANFLWTLVFFGLGAYWFSFFWLLLLWLLIWIVRYLFSGLNSFAGLLLLPYLIWVTFAGYLNLGIAVLN